MLSVFSDTFVLFFAKHCILSRMDFNVLVLVGGFTLLIASVISLFGLIPSCEIVFPGLTVFFGRTLISFFWHCILRFLDFLGVILVSVCVLFLCCACYN